MSGRLVFGLSSCRSMPGESSPATKISLFTDENARFCDPPQPPGGRAANPCLVSAGSQTTELSSPTLVDGSPSRFPIHIINPVDETKLSCYTSHRRSTTVSLETYPSNKKNTWFSLDTVFINPDIYIAYISHLAIDASSCMKLMHTRTDKRAGGWIDYCVKHVTINRMCHCS